MGTVVALIAYHLFRYVGDAEDGPVDIVTPTEAYEEDPPRSPEDDTDGPPERP
jgi:hypothetical protein